MIVAQGKWSPSFGWNKWHLSNGGVSACQMPQHQLNPSTAKEPQQVPEEDRCGKPACQVAWE